MMKRILSKLGLVLLPLVLFLCFMPSAKAVSSFTQHYYGSNFYYKVYVPSQYTTETPIPLLVMLHGCQQNPDDFAAGTRMNALAEQQNFIVLYPKMNPLANPNLCWNWFYDYNQHRGTGGEADIIKDMVDLVKRAYAIDANKVYVAGLSAGAAMSVIMGATYPDVFHGIGVMAGLEYNAADDALSAFSVMKRGSSAPDQAGLDAYREMGRHKRQMPVLVFHGTGDSTVVPRNGDQVVAQWVQTNDLSDDGMDNDSVDNVADQTTTGTVNQGRSYTRYLYQDNRGTGLIEFYKVNGMSHAWSGGSPDGSYTDPKGPDASSILWNFLTHH